MERRCRFFNQGPNVCCEAAHQEDCERVASNKLTLTYTDGKPNREISIYSLGPLEVDSSLKSLFTLKSESEDVTDAILNDWDNLTEASRKALSDIHPNWISTYLFNPQCPKK